MGYLQLGMLLDAGEEIGNLPPAMRESRAVLELSALIHLEAGAWQLLREVGERLTRSWPGEGTHWIWLAYGTRRCRSLAEAERCLLDALPHCGSEPMIHFNLACYAAQLGHLDQARERLQRARALDPAMQALALGDPDLQALWPELCQPPQR